MIYIASSWRNPYFDSVVRLLEAARFNVYNFKAVEAFSWSQVDEDYAEWDKNKIVKSLHNELAVKGYKQDKAAMDNSDTFVMVMPCGISASLELGWAVGKGKNTVILVPDDSKEPELMFNLADHVVTSELELLTYLIDLRIRKEENVTT